MVVLLCTSLSLLSSSGSVHGQVRRTGATTATLPRVTRAATTATLPRVLLDTRVRERTPLVHLHIHPNYHNHKKQELSKVV